MYNIIKRNNIHKKHLIKYSTNVTTDKSSYSNTVLLPKTKMPLRLEKDKLIQRDKYLNASSSFVNLYQKQRDELQRDEFILHDGPPYANGETHMGHAINKILKDVMVRLKILNGNKVSYIPGWDCHGLPIELKAVSNSNKLNAVQIRQRASNFAKNTVEKQRESFLSWGVCGDWNNAYKTYDIDYMKNQIIQFYNLYDKKLIYRDFKPVYWSPSTQTALAEAELEYNEKHKSPAIFLKLELKEIPDQLRFHKRIFALIWTTTPWTLPSNQAVCYNLNLEYALVEDLTTMDCYLVCANLVYDLSIKLNTELKVLHTFNGDLLRDVTYLHPLSREELKFLPGAHAVGSKGTGLVHTAPAHGPDDYLVALTHNIPVKSLVDKYGNYTEEAGKELFKLNIFTDGMQKILSMVKNDIVRIEDYQHSYPYDWRTKQPVFLRASKQWFIDTNSLKQRAIELMEDVTILPKLNSAIHKTHLERQLRVRPYWCISRQRCWGVPIPVFYNKSTDDIILNRDIINHYCSLFDKHGRDFWWTLNDKDILPEGLLRNQCDVDNVRKGNDIMDIWFDSGISWSSVLGDEKVADMVLEGVDQFTGWFQSSLLTSVALRDKAPYKTIYIHGFAVDEYGLKMSKSLGNIIRPKDIIEGSKKNKAYGVDTLRWWVACHASQDAIINVGPSVLQASNDEVQKIRSVLRFALSALSDYNGKDIEYNSLRLVDKYVLHMLVVYQNQIEKYLKDYQFHLIGIYLINFLTNKISALYYTSIKDRLYCDSKDSVNRRSAQFVLDKLLFVVMRSIAAIVPHLVEELYSHLPYKEAESFFQSPKCEIKPEWFSDNVENIIYFILDIKKEFNRRCSAKTENKKVHLEINEEILKTMQKLTNNIEDELLEILQIAEIEINPSTNQEFALEFEETNLHLCGRCRRYFSNQEGQLCKKCILVVEELCNKVKVAL